MGCPYHYHFHGPPPTPKETIQGLGCFIVFAFLVFLLTSISFISNSGFLILLAIVVAGAVSYYLFAVLPETVKDKLEDYRFYANISEEEKKKALNIVEKRKRWVKDLRLKWEKDMRNIKYWSNMPKKTREGRTESLIKEAEKYYIELGEEKADLKWRDYPEQEAYMNNSSR